MTEQAQVAEPELHVPVSNDFDGVDLLDLFMVLMRRRRMIAIVTFLAMVAGIIVALVLKPYFTANALILPPQQQQSASGLMLSQLGSLSGLGGAGAGLGLKSPADMYVGILQSRTIADGIIQQFHLDRVYKSRKMEDTRELLKKSTQIEAGKDGLIHISVTDRDPRLASDLANAYVNELYGINSSLAITEAAQRRAFFDQQLDSEKKALTAAEEDLRATQQRTGLIQLTGQAEMIIRTIAQLRAEIASREVELQATRTFATEQNPDVERQQQEISTMRGQLAKLENDQARQAPGSISVPAGLVPEESLEYARKLREVKYHETLFDLLSRQYEAAKIDEAKSAPIIQVIDHAIQPDKKSGPHGTLVLLAFIAIGFICACLWAFIEVGLTRLRANPVYAGRLSSLRGPL